MIDHWDPTYARIINIVVSCHNQFHFIAQAFIGQQYGKRPLPPVIPADEYETLFVALKGHKSRELKSVTLLDDWYQRDENSEPPAYILTNVHKKLPDFLSVSYSPCFKVTPGLELV